MRIQINLVIYYGCYQVLLLCSWRCHVSLLSARSVSFSSFIPTTKTAHTSTSPLGARSSASFSSSPCSC